MTRFEELEQECADRLADRVERLNNDPLLSSLLNREIAAALEFIWRAGFWREKAEQLCKELEAK